jgi:hypothetical protein
MMPRSVRSRPSRLQTGDVAGRYGCRGNEANGAKQADSRLNKRLRRLDLFWPTCEKEPPDVAPLSSHPGFSRKDVRVMSFLVTRLLVPVSLLIVLAGCRSPYYADQGALVGGLGGAGVGAIVGNAVGNTGAGALIGAGAGALGGAMVGNALDDVEARNRAQIAQQMAAVNMQPPVGAVTANDAVQMTRAGVTPELIVNHIRANGTVGPLQSADVIYLSQQGVHPDVIGAMQNPPARMAAAPVAMAPGAVMAPGPVIVEHVAPAPVIVEEHFYGPPRYLHHHHHHRRHHPPGVSWGVSVSH